jgi:hypothetical protein
MGPPARIDEPAKITLSLSAVCHAQMNELCEHFGAEPGRRHAMTRSEVVERAAAAMHPAIMPKPGKRKKWVTSLSVLLDHKVKRHWR